jgi:dipeptidyl aminopeptidase/acylaminoacyl peptidase
MKLNYLFLFIILSLGTKAQSVSDNYKSAADFQNKIKDKIYHSPGFINWIDATSSFWYVQQTPKGKEFIHVDATSKKKQRAFDHEKLASVLAKASNQTVKSDSLPFSSLTYMKEQNWIEVTAFNKKWEINTQDWQIKDKGTPAVRQRQDYWNNRRDDSTGEPVSSPDSTKLAVIRNNNVFVYPAGKPKELTQLSFDGSPDDYYSAHISWAPDSKKLATNKVRKITMRTINFIESSPEDQLQPKLQTRNYPKPGDALPQNQPVVFDLEAKKNYPVDPSLILNQYNLSWPQWQKDSKALWFEYNQRGHQNYILYKVDLASGKTQNIIHETSNTFIDYSGKKYRYDVNDSKEIIWASERDGWNHLYLYDGITGKVKNQITKGNWVVRRVVYVNEADRYLVFEGSGKESGQDPYLIQYYKVNFDGTGFTALTTENANHRATFSKDNAYFVDTYSRVDLPQVTVLRETATGKTIMELEKADISALKKTGWKQSEVFSAKGRDGVTDIWGVITRPTHFDPKKKYPVIENIYAGPHSSFVPKSFSANPAWMSELAELGFIVVQIDGMGTSNRSKAFHDVAWKNLKDAGFPDRIAWMKAAASKYPEMDITKVGIYGTSAGGQNAAGAVLFHPEFYKAAVASCGCHDNRIDKMWWNEQWMGYPIGPEYAECSNTENAHLLGGKLLLIVGEVDDNVDPASTYQFVDALIKANKDHDFIMVPGMGHSTGGKYGEQKRRDFFVKHLQGIEPPQWKN